ncbi:MAG: T9SS type A sorting domain-containing protein, partial [candidate division WOR-3 bacterium]
QGGYLLLEYYGTGLEEKKEGDKIFKVFPTLGRDFRIEGSKKSLIEIYDARGRLVKKLKENETSFSLKGKPAGIFFILSEKGQILKKVVNLR